MRKEFRVAPRNNINLLDQHDSTSLTGTGKDNSVKTTSGYSTDFEHSTEANHHPMYIALHVDDAKRGLIDDLGCNKRRLIVEAQFAAKNVKNDLAKGGLLFPKLNMSGSKILKDYGVNFKNVKVLRASEFSSSTFVKNKNSFYDEGRYIGLNNLITATNKLYEALGESDSDSSTSSFTSDESDISNSNQADSNLDNREDLNREGIHDDENDQPTDMLSPRPSITMTEALKLSNEPRLLVLSFYPFIIVHSNAEFFRLTGLSSAKVTGKPFSDLLTSDSKSLVKASLSVFSINTVNDIVASIKASDDKKHECIAKVTLVGAESISSDASHFLIEICPINPSLDNMTKDIDSAMNTRTGNILVG